MNFSYGAEASAALTCLNQFEPIQLAALDSVQLLNRVDSKFIFHRAQFNDLLHEMASSYYILDMDGRRVSSYESLYFDTSDFLLYRFHHNGKLNRLKVRFRRYADTGLTYFEVKYKVKATRTDKVRIPADTIPAALSANELQWVKHAYADISELQQKLWVRFTRLTLSAKNSEERATFDIGLSYDNFNQREVFPDLVVAEVKQQKLNIRSPMIQAFKKRHFEEAPFSKYAIGIALLEQVKYNAFKPNLLKLKKIINGYGRTF